ncbi:hypothetical protein PCK1_001023 [Pneumocystis canis]|nr:hypothetical protein PCK1_001023 [Pneumocystis canis]
MKSIIIPIPTPIPNMIIRSFTMKLSFIPIFLAITGVLSIASDPKGSKDDTLNGVNERNSDFFDHKVRRLNLVNNDKQDTSESLVKRSSEESQETLPSSGLLSLLLNNGPFSPSGCRDGLSNYCFWLKSLTMGPLIQTRVGGSDQVQLLQKWCDDADEDYDKVCLKVELGYHGDCERIAEKLWGKNEDDTNCEQKRHLCGLHERQCPCHLRNGCKWVRDNCYRGNY